MYKLNILASFLFLTALAACGGHGKKILVFASSKIQVDESQKHITITEGTTHNEKALEFSGSDPVTINVESPSGKFTLEAKEDGLYIANLQKDTVVGSYQHIGADNGKITYTPELLKHTLDSLLQLTAGLNVSAAAKNYFIPPNTIGKVSLNTQAKVFGPYTTVPSGFDAGTVPELYKFYTNKEVREIIDKLSVMVK